ncbi:MAG: murein L,D-transpeptidase catalytic domain family protein [Coxiellaceae bacterium]|nr:murein L,D-transpeptidase catalytic domain family protein [Coxiellaceae bacterium]
MLSRSLKAALLGCQALTLVVVAIPSPSFANLTSSLAKLMSTSMSPSINQADILANAPNLQPDALKYAVDGYNWAVENNDINNPGILTVVDFNLPSNKKRLWVIDLKTDKVLLNAYAAHGKGSGVKYADDFSNTPNSRASSLGVYKTLNTYYGHHGKSMRLQGLEEGINNNAYDRNIVVHPASYMTTSFVKAHNRAGRSWGCFALNPAISKQFIKLTKGGSVIFAYADEEQQDDYIA